jgi:hypothetical protein
MNKKELTKMAIKRLKSKEIQNYKINLCSIFPDKKNKNDCLKSFDKGFVKSFVESRLNK